MLIQKGASNFDESISIIMDLDPEEDDVHNT